MALRMVSCCWLRYVQSHRTLAVSVSVSVSVGPISSCIPHQLHILPECGSLCVVRLIDNDCIIRTFVSSKDSSFVSWPCSSNGKMHKCRGNDKNRSCWKFYTQTTENWTKIVLTRKYCFVLKKNVLCNHNPAIKSPSLTLIYSVPHSLYSFHVIPLCKHHEHRWNIKHIDYNK